uniref:Uncharacterized protein n=1 Tax=Ditylenchus dipsaci TaxID=166011 RepID=A0A915CMS8_9BILA
MFPADMCFSSSIVVNGSVVLNALLETNYIKNSPAWLISQEMQGNYNAAVDVSHGDGPSFVIDSHRIVETLCAEQSANIVKVILHSLEQPVDAFCGDVLMGSMQLLVNMLNTNFLPTHMELFKPSLQKRPIYLNLLHILYSTTGSEKPLANFLIKDFNLPRVIRDAIDEKPDEAEKRSLLSKISKRASF